MASTHLLMILAAGDAEAEDGEVRDKELVMSVSFEKGCMVDATAKYW